VNWAKMVQIQTVGERPWELAGWDFTWKDDIRLKQKVLMCGPIRVGALSYAVLETAGPDAPLVIQVDWGAIQKYIKERT
jgi:hypothetical protein